MARKNEVKQIIKNFPEHWDSLKQIEREVGSSFFSPNYIPEYACHGKGKNGKSFPYAEDVEKWVMRFETMDDMFEEHYESCMSSYSGLCE